MKFTHHPKSEEPFDFDPTVTYNQDEQWMKPKGFWLSVDDDWQRWCEAEGMTHWIEGNVVEFDMDVSKVLHIKDVSGLDEFHELYVKPNYNEYSFRINWAPLTRKFSGIMIAPYQWERRLDGDVSSWYYGWDVASACIWDLSILTIKSHDLQNR